MAKVRNETCALGGGGPRIPGLREWSVVLRLEHPYLLSGSRAESSGALALDPSGPPASPVPFCPRLV